MYSYRFPTRAKTRHDLVEMLVLAVKDNQPTLAEAIGDFFAPFKAAAPHKPPHDFYESLDKGPGRIEQRRCFSFDQLDCLPHPEAMPPAALLTRDRFRAHRWRQDEPGARYWISSLPAKAQRIAQAVRSHGAVENGLH
jgi:hypothetical protein